jgi:hypothetical protein
MWATVRNEDVRATVPKIVELQIRGDRLVHVPRFRDGRVQVSAGEVPVPDRATLARREDDPSEYCTM